MENKRNCNTCKYAFITCRKLKNDVEYSKLNGWKEQVKFKNNCVCDKYKCRFIEYPINVNKIKFVSIKRDSKDVGKLVEIQMCGEDCSKTHLGIYLGKLPIQITAGYSDKKELIVSTVNNPAIFVFDLNKIVYGAESWWKFIKGEKDLKNISEKDIFNKLTERLDKK